MRVDIEVSRGSGDAKIRANRKTELKQKIKDPRLTSGLMSN
jgi:hypothetical protein